MKYQLLIRYFEFVLMLYSSSNEQWPFIVIIYYSLFHCVLF